MGKIITLRDIEEKQRAIYTEQAKQLLRKQIEKYEKIAEEYDDTESPFLQDISKGSFYIGFVILGLFIIGAIIIHIL